MSELLERVKENHKKGYNCAQAVLCAYCENFGLSQNEAFKLAEGFGGGIGGMTDGTCGAVTAMYLLAGMKNSNGTTEGKTTKPQTYSTVKQLRTAFEEKNKSVICKELKGKGKEGIFRSCTGCMEDAASLIEELLL